MATTYNDTQIAVIDASGNISVIYPRTKASLVSLSATSYSNVEDCLAALGTAAFKNTSNIYVATGNTVATTKAVYDSFTNLSNKIKTYTAHGNISKGSGLAAGGEWHPTIGNIPSGYLLDTFSMTVISPAGYCFPTIDADGIGTTSIVLWVRNLHTVGASNVIIYWSVEVPY